MGETIEELRAEVKRLRAERDRLKARVSELADVLDRLADAATPFTDGRIVDETSGTMPLMEELADALNFAEGLLPEGG